jgi:hypothetical protein
VNVLATSVLEGHKVFADLPINILPVLEPLNLLPVLIQTPHFYYVNHNSKHSWLNMGLNIFYDGPFILLKIILELNNSAVNM